MPRKNNRMSWAEMFGQLPKQKRHKSDSISVRDAVKKRDGGKCRFPGCNRKDIQIHHVLFRSQHPSRKNDIENELCLCPVHHVLGKESPHQSDYFRRYWEAEAAKMYPEYFQEVLNGKVM